MAHEDRAAGTSPPERPYWLDDPRHVNLVIWGVGVVCALLLGAGLLIDKHGPFAIEHVFGFYALLGFGASVGLVVVARGLRVIINRPEDYYDR